MLAIIFQSGTERQWHTGQPTCVRWDEIPAIAHIQADGDELEFIQKQYSDGNNIKSSVVSYSIPLPRNRSVVRWFGSTAQTIIANL